MPLWWEFISHESWIVQPGPLAGRRYALDLPSDPSPGWMGYLRAIHVLVKDVTPGSGAVKQLLPVASVRLSRGSREMMRRPLQAGDQRTELDESLFLLGPGVEPYLLEVVIDLGVDGWSSTSTEREGPELTDSVNLVLAIEYRTRGLNDPRDTWES